MDIQTTDMGARVSAIDWHFVAEQLDRYGCATVDSVNYDGRPRDNYDVRSTGVIVAVNWL